MADNLLRVILKADTSQFSSGVNRAGSDLSRLSAQAQSVGSRLQSVLGVFGVALSVGTITAFVRNTMQGIEAIKDLAQATGASVENVSALEDVAARSGASFDVAAQALVRLNKALADAKPGSSAEQAFKALGLSVAELRRLDPVDALQKVAEAQAKFADDGNKSRLMLELTGKSLRDVLPLLNDMAEKGKGVATVTKEQADAAERFNEQLAGFEKNAKDAGRAILSSLLPAVNEAIKQFNAGREAFGGFWAALANLGTRANPANATAGLLQAQAEVARLRAEIEKVNGINPTFNARRTAALRAEMAEAQKLVRYYELLLGLTDRAGAGRGVTDPRGQSKKPSLPDALDGLKKAATSAKSAEVPADLAAALRAIEATDTAKIAQLTATLERLLKMQADGGEGEALAEAIRNTQAALDELRAKAYVGTVDPVMRAREEFNRLEKASYEAMAKEAEKSSDRITEFALEAQRNIQDALGDTLEQLLSGNFDNIARLWERMIYKMLAQAAAVNLNEALFGKDGGLLSTIGASISKALFNAKGNVFDHSGLVPFAKGGVVSRPTVFPFASGIGLMGEAGPEAILPLKRGADGRLGVSGSGVTVNVINNTNAQARVQERPGPSGTRIVDVIVEQMQARIAGDIARGSGPIPTALAGTYGLNRVAGAY
jgi:hypothetical protein